MKSPYFGHEKHQLFAIPTSENLGLAVVSSLSPVKMELAPQRNIMACASDLVKQMAWIAMVCPWLMSTLDEKKT